MEAAVATIVTLPQSLQASVALLEVGSIVEVVI